MSKPVLKLSFEDAEYVQSLEERGDAEVDMNTSSRYEGAQLKPWFTCESFLSETLKFSTSYAALLS